MNGRLKNKTISLSVLVPIIVALIAGIFGAIAGILNYITTPLQIEAELSKVQQQSETQIQLQRDTEVAKILTRLDDPTVYDRAGTALSLAVLGGEEIVPILVGKLRDSCMRLVEMEMSAKEGDDIEEEKRFVTALKQSLFTIGLPALGPLVELNRELRYLEWYVQGSRAVHEAESEAERTKIYEGAKVHLVTNDEIKDLIRSILNKVSGVEGSETDSASPIAQHKISLANIDLSYLVLWRINLAGVDLTNADLRLSQLTSSDFTNADLRNAILDKAVISGANFEGANLEGARLNGITWFEEARVEGANFSSTIIDSDALKEYLRQNGALNVPD